MKFGKNSVGNVIFKCFISISIILAIKMKLQGQLDDLQNNRRQKICKRDRLVARARQLTVRATKCRVKVLINEISEHVQ